MQIENVTCQSLMLDFANRTGLLDSGNPPCRYLWTDAFAVCNFLELFHQTADQFYLQTALALVDQVHQVLGRQRPDSRQQGWLSGLDEQTAQQHPVGAGLRIGKPLNERLPGDPVDDALEWQQDGQYFHYLTRWMYALDCVARTTREARYLQWALELARTAHAAFTYTSGAGNEKRMYWKMSIDLSRPLVASMGQHDPLDGLFTYLQLAATASSFSDHARQPVLKHEIQDMLDMCRDKHWATQDPLGIGGLLIDTLRLFQLGSEGAVGGIPSAANLLQDLEVSLQAFQQQNHLQLPAEYRLPFRELGLAIGLQALAEMQRHLASGKGYPDNTGSLKNRVEILLRYRNLHHLIEEFWLLPEHRAVLTWQNHADINSVMLATCLAPASYLGR